MNYVWAMKSAMVVMLAGAVASPASAASATGCEGGGFTVMTVSQAFSGSVDTTIPAGTVGALLRVRGRYVEFDVRADTFEVVDYALTGAANPLDLTGGVRTVLFASKKPEAGTLTSAVSILVSNDDLQLQRAGDVGSIKLQAKDCASGGIFQMEPQRADGGTTVITHTLGPGVFYFDNPNFRPPLPNLPLCPPGGPFTKDCFAVPVRPRINFANNVSKQLVGRDSTQVATAITQSRTRASWMVASGGRLGGVLGEDSTEVAPPATVCVMNCQAQNRGRGRFVNLGFPFPVPATSILPPP